MDRVGLFISFCSFSVIKNICLNIIEKIIFIYLKLPIPENFTLLVDLFLLSFSSKHTS